MAVFYVCMFITNFTIICMKLLTTQKFSVKFD
ncbi:hypothetical protein DSM106044_02384 [Robinsoniella peoriensis]|uniref:Uncharacterized protein n=1 Tax=Robinsoniella peoriensis TaxID=180332 RepID=A0A4U8Q7D8_9FIRM|nr:hypothetical protein DSM106044_02384 [Robinsoniella peoriensis]